MTSLYLFICKGSYERDLEDSGGYESEWRDTYTQDCSLNLQGDFTIICYKKKGKPDIFFTYQDCTYTMDPKRTRLDLTWDCVTSYDNDPDSLCFNAQAASTKPFKFTLV